MYPTTLKAILLATASLASAQSTITAESANPSQLSKLNSVYLSWASEHSSNLASLTSAVPSDLVIAGPTSGATLDGNYLTSLRDNINSLATVDPASITQVSDTAVQTAIKNYAADAVSLANEAFDDRALATSSGSSAAATSAAATESTSSDSAASTGRKKALAAVAVAVAGFGIALL